MKQQVKYTPGRFAPRCHFFVKNGQMHGRCLVRLRDGSVVHVQTRPGHGVPMSLLTHGLAMEETQGEVGGLFGNVWKGAKKAAKGIATGKVASDLLKTASSVARSDLGSVALSFVPGGTAAATAIKLGTQAADLLGKAQQGSKEAKEKILRVTQLAAQGHPIAINAKQILKAVHNKGKAKGVFPTKGSRNAAVVKVVPSKKRVKKAVRAVAKPMQPARVAPARVAPPVPQAVAPAPQTYSPYGRQGTYWLGLKASLNPQVYPDSQLAAPAAPVGWWMD